jgi:UDP-glucose 4-epimerase
MESTAEGVYNIACGQRISLNTLADLIMDSTGIHTTSLFEPVRSGDIHDSVADCSRARDAFGFTPQYTVKTGLDETVLWYKKRMDVAITPHEHYR